MKKIFICIATLGFALAASAQKKSGAIQFVNTIDPAVMAKASGITIPDEMLARMPKATKSNFELLFTANGASYMPVQDVEDSNGGGGGGGMGRMMMRFGGGSNREYFYSFADKKLSEVFDMSDTTYVMAGQLKLATTPQAGNMNMGGMMNFGGGGNNNNNNNNNNAVQFKNEPPVIEVVKTDETKTIVGYLCKKTIIKSTRKATLLGVDRDVTDETVLWHTNELGFDFSPNTNMWTEGAVLAIEARGNSTIASSIEFRNVSAKDVTAPKKATAITAEEFAAKMERMRNNMRNGQGGGRQGGGGGGQVRSIVIN